LIWIFIKLFKGLLPLQINLEALKGTSSERVNCMKAISITSFNSILFKAINPPRKSDSFPPRDFRFHIFFAPSFEGGENSLCHTVSIWHFATLFRISHFANPTPLLAHLAPLFFWQCTLHLPVQCKVPLEKCSKFN